MGWVQFFQSLLSCLSVSTIRWLCATFLVVISLALFVISLVSWQYLFHEGLLVFLNSLLHRVKSFFVRSHWPNLLTLLAFLFEHSRCSSLAPLWHSPWQLNRLGWELLVTRWGHNILHPVSGQLCYLHKEHLTWYNLSVYFEIVFVRFSDGSPVVPKSTRWHWKVPWFLLL
jgi:hypothetical protein